MTVSTTSARVSYAGDGTTKAFAVSFPFFDADDLVVIERAVSTGVETVKALATDYQVAGGGGTTGTVTMNTAPAAGVELHILRATDQTQTTDYAAHDTFPAESHERALDRAALRDQELARDIARAIRAARTDSASLALELPTAVARASKYLLFDAGGNVAVGAGPTVDTSVLVVVSAVDPGHVNGRIWIDTATANTHIFKQSDGAQWAELYRRSTTTDVASVPALLATVAQVLAGTEATKLVTPDLLAAIFEDGGNIASAATIAVPAGGGGFFHVTGTTNVGAIDSAGIAPGFELCLVHDGVKQMTHGANLILQGAANRTTAAGDVQRLRYDGASVWREVGWHPASIAATEAAWPRGYIDGFPMANNGVDPNNDIDIGVGAARSDDNSENIVLAASITKRLDAAWAAGTNQGGLDTGAKAASSGYFRWAIKNTATSAVDVLYSLSATAPTMPTGYTKKRPIGWSKTDGSGNIIPTTQNGEEILLTTPVLDVDVTNLSTAAVLYTLPSLPAGIKVEAILGWLVYHASASRRVHVSSPDQADQAPSDTVSPLSSGVVHDSGTIAPMVSARARIRTNASGQIRARADAASTTFRVVVHGWIDRRGRDA